MSDTDAQQAETEGFKHDEKRNKKPTLKVIENLIQEGRSKLEVAWNKTKTSIEILRKTTDSVDLIRTAINDVRSLSLLIMKTLINR